MSSVALHHVASRYSLGSVATPLLVRQLDALAAQEHCTDADVLAHIAELDAREEYLGSGHSSMQDYCVRRLRMSEDRANKRIRVCRTALEYPAIFEMLADGRLNLTAVLMLKSRLTPENASELLDEAALTSNDELERLLARRFPKPVSNPGAIALELTPGIAGESEVEVAARPPLVPSGAAIHASSTGPLSASNAPALFAKFTPLSAEHVSVRGQLSMAAYEQFLRVRALAAHRVPSGNAALVIELALKLATDLMEKQKFGKGVRTRPRGGQPIGRSLYPERHPPGGLRAGWRLLHVHRPGWHALHRRAWLGVRPHRAAREGRPDDRRQSSSPVALMPISA